LEQLKKMMIEMATIMEENLNAALRAVSELDARAAAPLAEADHEVDKREVAIEEECLKIIALHQPVADHLRFVVSVLKINHDLERIGDLAVDIARRVPHVQPATGRAFQAMVVEAGRCARSMANRAVSAVVDGDSQLAREVWAGDDEVDDQVRRLLQALEERAKSEPQAIASLLQLAAIAWQIERLGDHAANIAKDVIYMAEGKIARHRLTEAIGDMKVPKGGVETEPR
jgi:phosphate transport system protein